MVGLDGLRGVAVAAVIVYHFQPSWLPGGFIGVDVFFVLSGFLISSLLLRERITEGSVDLKRFFLRRLRRLMPALLLLIATLAVYAAFWAEPIELTRLRRHGLAALAYVSNWVFIEDGTTYTDVLAGASPLRHVWSLAIEEQLYLVLAAGVVATAMIGRPSRVRHRFGVLAALLALASAAWMAWLNMTGTSTARTYFGTDTRAHSMLVGAVIGAALLGRPVAATIRVRSAGWAGLGVLVTIAFVGSEDAAWMYRGGFLLVALAAGAVVIAAASDPTVRRVLSIRLLVAIGAVSYGLYLWHWAVLIVFDQERTGLDGVALTALRLAITVAAALLSYVLVEQPIRAGAIGKRWGRRSFIPAAGIIASVISVLVIATAARPLIQSTAIAAAASTSVAPPPSVSPPPSPSVSLPAASLPSGSLPANELEGVPDIEPAAPIRVTVLGDSVAHSIIGGEFGPAVMQIVPWSPDQTTFDPSVVEVTSIAKPACSFISDEIAFREPNGAYSHVSLAAFCVDWRSELRGAIPSTDLLLVHLSNDLEDRWIDGERLEFGTPQYFALLESFLDDLHQEVAAAGFPMLLVASAPRAGPIWPEAQGKREHQVLEFYERWALNHPEVSVVDLGVLVCPNGVCPEDDGDDSWRWDGRHYTRPGAERVAAWLTPEIIRAAAQER